MRDSIPRRRVHLMLSCVAWYRPFSCVSQVPVPCLFRFGTPRSGRAPLSPLCATIKRPSPPVVCPRSPSFSFTLSLLSSLALSRIGRLRRALDPATWPGLLLASPLQPSLSPTGFTSCLGGARNPECIKTRWTRLTKGANGEIAALFTRGCGAMAAYLTALKITR